MTSLPRKLSIVTVCFNAANTLRDTLTSVARQSYPLIEHIVIDGGSTDGTVDLIREEGARVSTWSSEPDRGIYDAMNKGILASSGEVIAFLNADDVYANCDVVARAMQQFAEHELDLVYGDVVFVKRNDLGRVVRVYSSHKFRPSRIAWGWMPAHPSMFVAKPIFERFGLFRQDYRIAGDYEFVARIFSKSDLSYRYLAEVIVKMRVGGVSTRSWRNTMLLNQEVLRACRDNGIDSNYIKILSKYPSKMLEMFKRPRKANDSRQALSV
jgi:glycosyltransferase involved in cell wall biosynthesis